MRSAIGVIGVKDTGALLHDAFVALGSADRHPVSFSCAEADGVASGLSSVDRLRLDLAQAHCAIAGFGESQLDGSKSHETVGAMLIGRVSNLRPLRRRLVAAGRAQPNDEVSAVVRSLLSLFMARRPTIEDALSAACEHVAGEYAMIAFAAPPGRAPILAGAQRGHPLFLGLSVAATILTSNRAALSVTRFDSVELEPGDIAVASGDRVVLTDAGGMQIRRSAGPSNRLADAEAAPAL